MNFKINGQTLYRTDSNTIIANSQNYLYADFSIPEGYTGIAYFSVINSGTKYGTQMSIINGNVKCQKN